jgi:hypothetical protein
MQRTEPPSHDSLDFRRGQGDAFGIQGDAFGPQGDAFFAQSDRFAQIVTLFGKFPQDPVRCVNTPFRQLGG